MSYIITAIIQCDWCGETMAEAGDCNSAEISLNEKYPDAKTFAEWDTPILKVQHYHNECAVDAGCE